MVLVFRSFKFNLCVSVCVDGEGGRESKAWSQLQCNLCLLQTREDKALGIAFCQHSFPDWILEIYKQIMTWNLKEVLDRGKNPMTLLIMQHANTHAHLLKLPLLSALLGGPFSITLTFDPQQPLLFRTEPPIQSERAALLIYHLFNVLP